MQGGGWNAKTSFLQASTRLVWKKTNNSTYITEECVIAGKCRDKDHNAANAQVLTPILFCGLCWVGEFSTHLPTASHSFFKTSFSRELNKEV